MSEELRRNIGEVGYPFEPITGIYHEGGKQPWQLFMLERDVEFEGQTWRVVIVERCFYDPDDLEAVDYAEDILAEAWPL